MKILIAAALATLTLATATTGAQARPWHHHHWGRHHRVCSWRHGHRFCRAW